MLLGFGAKNFYSFKEGFEVNLKLGSGCPKDISKGRNYANIIAVKGANASGKTNVLKALSFISDFATNSFAYKTDIDIPFDNFFKNDESTHLYITFMDSDTTYKYEVELNNKKVISEIIYKKNVIVIKRVENKLEKVSKEFEDIKIVKLRDNASIISTARQYDSISTINIYFLLMNIISNVDSNGLQEQFIKHTGASNYYKHNENHFTFVKEVLQKSDTGIFDIRIEEDENKETKVVTYFPLFDYKVNSKIKTLTYNQQSSGVKLLFKQLTAYKLVLDNGGVLVLDEFDINLHPDLLPALIDFFDNPEKNPKGAQLIFTTHNTEIIDNLKKYRVVLVNKEENESFLYRLDEISDSILRNDRPLTPLYNSGKIGGKPKLEL